MSPRLDRLYHATHGQWESPIRFFANGYFIGGGASPDGRWEVYGGRLILKWYSWSPETLIVKSPELMTSDTMTIQPYDFKKTFGISGLTRFGDSWAFFGIMSHLSTENNASISVSKYLMECGVEHDMSSRFDEISKALTGTFAITDSRPDIVMPYCMAQFGMPSARTRVRWAFGPYRRICYQIHGASFSASLAETEKILGAIPSDYSLVKLGVPLSIEETVELLSTSDAFIGVSSGMAQIAQSVGTPTFLVEFEGAQGKYSLYHRAQQAVVCEGANDCIRRLRSFFT